MLVKKFNTEDVERKKSFNRRTVGTVLGIMVVASLVFWWQGGLDDELRKSLETEKVVWRKDELITDEEEGIVNNLIKVDASEVEGQIREMVSGLKGTYVVYGKKLKVNSEERKSMEVDNYEWELQVGDVDSQMMQAASLIKLPVMVAVYRMAERRVLDLDSVYRLRDVDRAGGSGSLVGKPEGYEVSLRKLVWHMGNESDNTAFQAIVNMVGVGRLEEEFVKMGLMSVSIEKNQITAREVGDLFEGIYIYKLVLKDSSDELLFSMMKTWYEDRIPVGVPIFAQVAHKVGTEIGVVGDAGIVYSADGDYLLVIMSEGVREAEAKEVLPEISRVVWEWQEKFKVKN